ncbi:MAG: leucyl aminopeptidase [Pseudomonadota bacterium]
MEFSIKKGPLAKQKTACLVLGVNANKKLTPAAAKIDKAARGTLSKILKRGDLSGKSGESLLIADITGCEAERILLVGLGRAGDFDLKTFRKSVGAAAKKLNEIGVRNALSTLAAVAASEDELSAAIVEQVVAFDAAAYRFNELKSKPSNAKLTRAGLWVEDADFLAARDKLADAKALAAGIALTKDLANRPANHCTPTDLANTAKAMHKDFPNLKVTVLEEKQMEKLGMGSLLSVSAGSRQPAKLITMEYYGGAKDQKPVVLVGKGVTFDSGGISIKPSPKMDEMKFDMSGAASVIGTMRAVVEMAPAMNVVGVVPATENLPDGLATKPGDVVKSMSGQTIEILNTDAEGRLILCDALTYSAKFNPAVVVDIATLTGACVIALGGHASGLMSNDDELADDLLAAGQRSGDRAWRLPLWDDYQRQLDSNFADMANVGGRAAGTITAACFLARFTKDYRWAHIDIAGTAWLEGGAKGSTGRPVRLLMEYLNGRLGSGD